MHFSPVFRSLFPLWTLVLSLLLFGAFAMSPVFNTYASEAQFQAGIAAFQKGDHKQARASFQEALKNDENNPTLLFNLALVAQTEGELGLALALWRKALALKPDFSAAKRAISWAEAQLDPKELPHEVTFWESLRKRVLVDHSLNQYLGLTALLLFAFGWMLLRYFGLRRRAFLEEKPLPPFPSLTVFGGFLLAAGLFLTGTKAYDLTILRGTILAKKIEARSAADPNGTPLFDLYEGLEVIIRQTSGEWVQVTYPGASTGWIPKSTVFTIRDKAAP